MVILGFQFSKSHTLSHSRDLKAGEVKEIEFLDLTRLASDDLVRSGCCRFFPRIRSQQDGVHHADMVVFAATDGQDSQQGEARIPS
jgi:hypothetical protein